MPIESGNLGPFDIVDVGAEFVIVSWHSKTNKPVLKFEGNAPGAVKRVIIGITPDF